MIGFSRLVLGLHSLDQVLLGHLYGFWLTFFMFRYVRPPLSRHLRQLLESPNNREFALQSNASIRNSTLFYVMVALSTQFCLMIFSIVNFLIASSYFTYPDKWITEIINKCGGETEMNTNNIMNNEAFIKTGLVSNIFGAYYGIIIDSMYFNGTPSSCNNTVLWKSLVRALVAVVCLGPLLLPYILIGSKHNMMILYLVKSTLPFFILMLCCFGLMKLLFMRLKLLNLNINI